MSRTAISHADQRFRINQVEGWLQKLQRSAPGAGLLPQSVAWSTAIHDYLDHNSQYPAMRRTADAYSILARSH